jgi:hypothetical protein
VTPDSASAKEIQQLWTYVQGRLARLKSDAGFAPAERQSFAINGLSPADASEPADAGESVEATDMSVAPAPAPATPKSHAGIDRPSGLDRRRGAGEAPRGFDNRRIVKPFGRRSTDDSTDASFRESRP